MLLLPALWMGLPQTPEPTVKRWVKVETQRLDVHLGLAGRLRPVRQEILTAPFDGTVEALLVSAEQEVASGQPLLRLATIDIDIQWRQAEAERLSAKREVERLRGWHASPEMARSIRALGAARSALAAAEGSLNEARRLFERGIVPRIEVDSLEQAVQAQRAAVHDAQLELEQTRARGQGEALVMAEMALASAQERLLEITAMRERKVVMAPFTGLLAPANVNAGSTPSPLQVGLAVTRGMPLLILSDMERLAVFAKVQERDLDEISEGMDARVTISGHVFSGRLTRIGQQARNDPGPGVWYDVQVDLLQSSNQTQPILRLGMSAQLEVLTYTNTNAMLVPAQALREDEAGGFYVVLRTATDPLPRRTQVLLGKVVTQGVEVKGLEAGFVQLP
ncbi:efflux RND transporter periplasmic adaptor subunit [Pseudomonas promysalinigenes]|uniref:efflux RND transporter periplasmic adaptor subunit n=1 Tax=Pseudomonas promysalinigenes TaxID=485898 RepID=UPI003F9EBB05